jgi:hypothetical protein
MIAKQLVALLESFLKNAWCNRGVGLHSGKEGSLIPIIMTRGGGEIINELVSIMPRKSRGLLR